MSLARAAWAGLALMPVALAVWRNWTVYEASADGLWRQYRSVSFYPTDAVALGVVALWGVGLLANRERVPGMRQIWPVAVGLLSLSGTAAFSIVRAHDSILALGIATELALLSLFYLAAVNLLGRFGRGPIVLAFAVVVVLQALLGIEQGAAQSTGPVGRLLIGWDGEYAAAVQGASVVLLPGVGRWLRAYGSFPHPNILGGFLAVALVTLLASVGPMAGHQGARGRWTRRAAWAGVAAALVGLLLTVSRAAWLGALLGAGVNGAVRWRTRKALAAAVGLAPLLVLARLAAGGSIEQTSMDERLFYDQIAWQVAERFGSVGAGNLVVAQQALNTPWSLAEPAHNVLLIGLAEMGAAGVAAWTLLLGGLLAIAWQRRRVPAQAAGPLAALGLLLPLLMLDHYLWTQPPGRALLVWALALLTHAPVPNMECAPVRVVAANVLVSSRS